MYGRYVKRALDFLFALYLILPIILAVLLCALLIRLEDWRPAFNAEKCVGRYGRVFRIYILRTTKVNAAGDVNHDPGLTNMGRFMIKTGIADISQVFNIFFGDMNFIGPRPEPWESAKSYTLDELRKLQVRPGIIGYSQIFCRDSADLDLELKNDIYYANNLSLALDFKILSKTIKADLLPKRI